jgi:arginyl-tRNA synthetase
MIKQEIEKAIRKALGELGLEVEETPLEHPENAEHGDYSTSVAMHLKTNPNKIAEKIASDVIEKTEVVNGFINFFVSKEYLVQELLKVDEKYGKGHALKGKKIMVEFGHPNTHKEMHIGHMRTLITGEALSRIFEANGAKVFRANYQGDIGPHVAKAIWGTEKVLRERGITWDEAEKFSHAEKAHVLGEGYVIGNKEYDEHEQEIDEINRKLYVRHEDMVKVYEQTRKWSLDYYAELYERFGTKYDGLFFESDVAASGKEIVQKNIGNVFEESEGAIIFDGEKYGLHKRVFITKDGNPTYEAKEMGLAPVEYKAFPFDFNIHVVANEQAGYFQVVIKALALLDKKFKDKQYHLSMGMVQLVGKKMSSRTGEIITVDGLLEAVKESLRDLITTKGLDKQEIGEIAEVGTIGAVKYSVLRTDTKSNAVFDIENSVSLNGDSGPYVQYTYARCRSILRKAQGGKQVVTNKYDFSKQELDILRLVYRFPEIVQEAAERYASNLICNYAHELAQKYNTFYNTHSVLEANTEEQKHFRILLTASVAQILKNSLYLLGIKSLERM